MPEPKGLTYMKLDLFEKKTDAQKFRRMQTSLSESGYFSVEIGGIDGAVKWHSGKIRKSWWKKAVDG